MMSREAIRWVRFVWIGLFAWLVIWATGDVMRESDQASVIDGAIELARDGQLSGRSFYNYDRTFLSYWILAPIYKLTGLDATGASLTSIVVVGNYTAAAVLLLGLVTAFLVAGPERWWEWVCWLACLLSPVFLFSAPLLSSNIISAGFLFVLAAVLSGRSVKKEIGSVSVWADVGAAVLAFLAIAARADAVLLMPLMAFLSVKRLDWRALLSDRRLWLMAMASIMALILGSGLSTAEGADPQTFFNPLLFTSFIALGMNAALLLLLVLLAALVIGGVKQRKLFDGLIALALLMPLVFYWNLLYTPRHLMTLLLGLLLFVMLPRGRGYLAAWCQCRLGRVMMGLIAIATGLSFFVGLNLSSMKSGKLCSADPTLYPTADGYWPMGANAWFFMRLRDAEHRALDHNQRVWDAWKSVPADDVPDRGNQVKSNGLVSLGELWLRVMGKEKWPLRVERVGVIDGGKATVTLFDERSLVKMPLHISKKELEGVGDWVHSLASIYGESAAVVELSDVAKEVVYMVGSDKGVMRGLGKAETKSERWDVIQAIRPFTQGDDYIIVAAADDWSGLHSKAAYRWLLAVPDSISGDFEVWREGSPLHIESLGLSKWGEVFEIGATSRGDQSIALELAGLPSGIWLARSSLLGFMQRKNY